MKSGPRTALSGCNLPLTTGQKYVTVRLLTGDSLNFVTEVKDRCRHVYEQVINYLGLNDAELFGLAIKRENEYQFMDQSTKLHKCACKAWRSQHGTGLDESGSPLLVFHLRVQLYVDCHLLISDKVARHHYYLQLKENVLQYFLPLSEERAFLLAANALQADLGNFQADKHTGNYFHPLSYFPFWVVKRYGEAYIRQHAPAMHKDNLGQSRGEAQVGYIKEASEVTAPHNLHLYKMRRKKTKTQDTVWLGVSAKSLEVFEENGNSPKSHLSRFAWADIAKLTFEKKKFEIRSLGVPDSRKFVYYSSNEDIAKGLFWLCRLTHQFNMAVLPKEQELRKMELEGRKSFRESYIYSDSSELSWEPGRSDLLGFANGFLKMNVQRQSLDPRVSVISNSSSNTTSGIVSDKVHSFCESEVELDMEIMITSPPVEVSPNENIKSEIKSSNKASPGKHKARSVSADFNPLIRSANFSLLEHCLVADTEPDVEQISSIHKITTVPSKSFTSDPTTWTYVSASANGPPVSKLTAQELPTHSCQQNCLFHSTTNNATKELQKGHRTNNLQKTEAEDLRSSGSKRLGVLDHKANDRVDGNFKISLISSKPKSDLSIINTVNYRSYENKRSGLMNHRTSLSNDSSTLDLGLTKHRTRSDLGLTETINHKTSMSTDRTKLGLSLQRTNDNTRVESGLTEAMNHKINENLKLNLGLTEMVNHRTTISNDSTKSDLGPIDALHPALRPHNQGRIRIGVSSLNRVQKLPLTLFGSGQAGSEPNLNHMPTWAHCQPSEVPSELTEYYKNVSSCSGVGNLSTHRHSVATDSTDYARLSSMTGSSSSRSTGSIPQDLSTLALSSSSQFVYVPPPPAYRTSHPPQQLSQHHSVSLQTLQERAPELRRHSQAESQSVLDLYQLRQKSLDLDLPLMAALCNDRSLVALPKTVPTCSRQRHIQASKDVRRFSCSHVSSLSDNPSDFPQWHTGSSEWVNRNGETTEGYGRPHSHSCPPPPTILTSLMKRQPEALFPNGQNAGTRQMLPLKLSLIHSSAMINGCVHAT